LNKFFRDLRKVPVIRILFPYVLGIITERFLQLQFFPEVIYIAAVSLMLITYGITFLADRKIHRTGRALSLAYFLLFMGFGISNSRCEETGPPGIIDADSVFVSGVLISDIEEKENVYRITMEAEQWLVHDSLFTEHRNLVLFIRKDSLSYEMYAGERWCFGGRMKGIRNNGNPGEFDYADYMQRRDFRSTLFVDANTIVKLSDLPHGKLKYLPQEISRRIVKRWNKTSPDLPVLSAITLGDKSLLSHETKSEFAGSGAMHLLAVSGLHVGMIWWILDLLIVFPKRKRIFRFVKVLIILGILWIYAAITGFSDSVTRAVTMFSLVSVAKSVSRNSNIFNTLFLSALILLLLNPLRIFEPGFQLSYLAVFGIVTIHPLLSSLFTIENKFIRRITDLIFVSIAAQLSTLPLSLLFFNQFPVYFILTNLFAIPIVSVLLGLFVLFSPMFLLDFHPEFFSMILLKITHVLNQGISIISSLPGAVIENIPMNTFASLLLIVVVFTLAAFAIYKRIIWLFISASSLIVILLFSSAIRLPGEDRNGISVYNFTDCTAISTFTQSKHTTYIFYQDKKPSGFVYNYLASLKTINLHSSEFLLVEIATDVMDSAVYEGLTCISDGTWEIELEGQHILICGSCREEECEVIMESLPWDVVVFRTGLPFYQEEDIEFINQPVIIADGTLKSYELDHLKGIYPDLYSTSIEGAWTGVSGI